MFYVFLFCPVVVSRPKKNPADFCKTWFLIKIYVYSHLCIVIVIQIYIYIYIHVCVYCYVYIYMCLCVCVGGAGLPQNEVSFFPLKQPVLEPKKDTSFWDISMYIQYIFFDMHFFLYILCISCVGLSHPKYMFPGFLLYVVFQHHFIGQMYQIKKCFIGDYNIDRYIYI